jgi:hypothetical protein
VQLDASSYVSDANGYIYPIFTNTATGTSTNCGVGGYVANYTIGVEFSIYGLSITGPVLTVAVDCQTTYNQPTGPFGTCGSC